MLPKSAPMVLASIVAALAVVALAHVARSEYAARETASAAHSASVSRTGAGRPSTLAGPSADLRRAAPPAPGAGASTAALIALRDGKPLDLNRATRDDLALLPGVGPKLAARIVEERTQHGCFGTVDALSRVSGIGPVKLERVRAWLQVASAPCGAARERGVTDPASKQRTR